jgi:hypothetical protein
VFATKEQLALATQRDHSPLVASPTCDEQVAPELRVAVPPDPKLLGIANGNSPDLRQGE